MSEQMLQSVLPELSELPADQVRSPDLPLAVALQEGHDLLTLIQGESVWPSLAAVGVQAGRREQLQLLIGAARAAESNWVVMRDRKKSQTQQELEARAYELRSTMLAAVRWNLRHDAKARTTLSAILEGEGVEDLTQDLSDAAELCERNLDAFEADQSFDALARIAEARALYAQLAAGTSAERLDTEQAKAVDLRNRAYTQLDDLTNELREAGRYAFRGDDTLRARFASAYDRRKRQQRAAARRRTETRSEVGSEAPRADS